MVSFLKLATVVINLSSIKFIDIKNDNNLDGYYNMFKIGNIISKGTQIDINKNNEPEDYRLLQNWINKCDQ